VSRSHTHDPIASYILAGSMWWYAANVLYPAQILKRAGISVFNQKLGESPKILIKNGLGQHFSGKHQSVVFIKHRTENDHLVEEFDKMSHIYQRVVEPFSQPIFEESLKIMRPYLPSNARVLDAGCGPGNEVRKIALLVPKGEVVGVDLSAGMIKTASRVASARGLHNCAFFQADIGDLPRIFDNSFDLVYNCLAHHHYPDPSAATSSIFRVLRQGGVYCVIDPGPEWYNILSSPIAKLGDPGWIGFNTPQQFIDILKRAGFTRCGWYELLPGFGLAIGQKAIDEANPDGKKTVKGISKRTNRKHNLSA
jgi:SAM-dependent methyltransferase